MSKIDVAGWDNDGELPVDFSETNYAMNRSPTYLSEEEVIDLTVQLLASMKHKPAMQAAMERKLDELAKHYRAEESHG